HPLTGQWQILLSSTAYATSRVVTLGGGTDLPVPGDYDGDGITDVAVFHRATAEWQIVNSSTGTTTAVTLGVSGDLPVSADYDGDGKTDVAVFHPANGQWQILKSSSSTLLTVGWGASIDVPGPSTVLANSLAVQARPRVTDVTRASDFDADGKTDITVYRPANGTWYTLKSKSGYLTQTAIVWGTSTDIPVAGDYDGDGRTDPA